jgi:hypothetical protein
VGAALQRSLRVWGRRRLAEALRRWGPSWPHGLLGRARARERCASALGRVSRRLESGRSRHWQQGACRVWAAAVAAAALRARRRCAMAGSAAGRYFRGRARRLGEALARWRALHRCVGSQWAGATVALRCLRRRRGRARLLGRALSTWRGRAALATKWTAEAIAASARLLSAAARESSEELQQESVRAAEEARAASECSRIAAWRATLRTWAVRQHLKQGLGGLHGVATRLLPGAVGALSEVALDWVEVSKWRLCGFVALWLCGFVACGLRRLMALAVYGFGSAAELS